MAGPDRVLPEVRIIELTAPEIAPVEHTRPELEAVDAGDQPDDSEDASQTA